MNQIELQQFLTGFAGERLALLERHEAGARVVAHYDFNNVYQYVIGREETHLTWVQTALADFGQPLPAAEAALPVPDAPKPGKRVETGDYRAILEDDAKKLAAFIDRWGRRLDAVTHARHRRMLDVILGESREHQRLFEQASAGFEDVLGRRTAGAARVGGVLPTRWIE